jgi:hypothetical protein
MSQDSVKCPKCSAIIPLSEALSHDIEERAQLKYESQLAEGKKQQEAALKTQERAFEAKLEAERKTLAAQAKKIEEQAQKDRQELEAKLKKQAHEEVCAEMADLKARAEEQQCQLQEAQKNELALRKRQRELEDKERALELETERRLSEELKKVEDTITSRLQEQHRLKDAEKDKTIADAKRQLEEMKRKMEQGSQQTQGEVLEIDLEERFRREFAFDEIEPVSKGVRGADILQIVKTQSGRTCGKILWETKRVKNWSESWVQKLKDDQGDAKADIAVLVSEALPAGFHHFRQMSNGVWVTDVPSALSLALALRMVLIQVSNAKEAESGKDDNKDLIYRYVTGPEFRNRVTTIIEGFRGIKEELESEKRAMQRIWEKREKQVERIISNTAGMYGDLEGLAGLALPKIQVLELPDGADDDPSRKDP